MVTAGLKDPCPLLRYVIASQSWITAVELFHKFIELDVIEIEAQMLSLWLQPASQQEHSRTTDLYRVAHLQVWQVLLLLRKFTPESVCGCHLSMTFSDLLVGRAIAILFVT